jgi:hypothetical protein
MRRFRNCGIEGLIVTDLLDGISDELRGRIEGMTSKDSEWDRKWAELGEPGHARLLNCPSASPHTCICGFAHLCRGGEVSMCRCHVHIFWDLRMCEPGHRQTWEPANLRTCEPANLRTCEPPNPRTSQPWRRGAREPARLEVCHGVAMREGMYVETRGSEKVKE